MAQGLPRKAAMAAVAYDAAQPAHSFGVWADNWKSAVLFRLAVRSKCWRFSFGGPVALDMKLVARLARRHGIKLSLRREADLEIMASEAIIQMDLLQKNSKG